MRAWAVVRPGPIDGEASPIEAVARPVPSPGPGEILVKVSTCGVCRTDLHVVEGDLPPHRAGVVPGHEVVGRVEAVGRDLESGRGSGLASARFVEGDRVGIPWLRHTCGVCRWCRSGRENLCVNPAFTGWDADGGYAEFAVVDSRYAYAIPDVFDDEKGAPLLCAGIIGFRALRRCGLPPGGGGRLGIYGFGGSAHLAAQVALYEGATVHVMTRSRSAQELARSIGVASAQGSADPPPEPLDAAILFAPVGDLVPPALAALDRGGMLAVAGIHLSDIPVLNYQRHLFQERQVGSVTANTRADGEEFLRIAAQIPIKVTTTPFGLSEAPAALLALAHDQVEGAAVLYADR
ncbi:MAG: zinc-dependent alcohol dehydrogenase family protein [Actinomycetota bacterium]|nr:zinc-dependent alcohol dehydrogenase family protein [Actinomycetota bacterium]MDQ6946684.1 zinc-dependent alcohol dehydrogenase family protein [Actinomycetota bacterium]